MLEYLRGPVSLTRRMERPEDGRSWPELAGDENRGGGGVAPRGELAVEEEELRQSLGKLCGIHAMILTPGIGLSFAAPETEEKGGLAAEKEELQKFPGSCRCLDTKI